MIPDQARAKRLGTHSTKTLSATTRTHGAGLPLQKSITLCIALPSINMDESNQVTGPTSHITHAFSHSHIKTADQRVHFRHAVTAAHESSTKQILIRVPPLFKSFPHQATKSISKCIVCPEKNSSIPHSLDRSMVGPRLIWVCVVLRCDGHKL